MKCPACQTENAPGVAFCSRCSTPLPPGAPGGQPVPSGEYPPPGQQPSGEQYPPGAYGQGTPPGAQHPSGDQYPAAGQYPSGEQYPSPGQPPGGQYPPPGQQPSGEQYPPGAYGQGTPPGYGGPPYPPGGYGGPPGGSRPNNGRVLLIVVALLAVGAIVAALVVFNGDGDGGGSDGGSDEVVLEPIGSVQEDDFAGNLDVETLGESTSLALGGAPDMQDEATATLSGRVAEGGAPGLYGGSRDSAVCDVDRLVEYLADDANADKAAAWAGVHGIGTDEITDYVRDLTAVRLRFDTRVTNHGFEGGDAADFQSLLQAGTAVLVDAEGVPRVKCNCGNPLLEPEALGDASEGEAQNLADVAQNPDAEWDGLDPAAVVSIEPAPEPVEDFTVVEIEDGALFDRPVGSNGDADTEPSDVTEVCDVLGESPSCGGSGEEELELGGGNVQITLEWASNADLDLHVTEPDGNEIYYANRGPSASGGQLDVDSNTSCDLDGAVENVFWPEESPAPPGEYAIEVTGFAVGEAGGPSCGGGDYTLTIAIEGQDERVESGTVADDESDPYTFTVG